MRRSRMLNAGVDVNGFEPVSFDELVSNNAVFLQIHADIGWFRAGRKRRG